MKKIIAVITISVVALLSSSALSAGDFGLTAGVNFAGVTKMQDVQKDAKAGYLAGISYKFKLPLGFSVQPGLLCSMSSSAVDSAIEESSKLDFKLGYLQLPVSLQWGPDLIFFRPFVDCTPYIGCNMNGLIKDKSSLSTLATQKWDPKKELDYGVGLGFGVEVWKLQVVGRYNWSFGKLYNADGEIASGEDIKDNINNLGVENQNYGGVTLSVSLLF